MGVPNQQRQILRFGVFEFDPPSGELRKHGIKIKLQGQPVAILGMLLERSGEVVTREEMQQKLWPADTYVDFEHSLNAAVKRLRVALGDSADAPRFVETLARRGYRFIAPLSAPPQSAPQAQAPEGVKPSEHRRYALPAALIAAAIFTVVLGLNVAGVRDRVASRPVIPTRSLVVLPLNNVSGDPEQDYFADGMTDALNASLSGVSALRVISRTSSMVYKGTRKPLPQIARELNVDAVMEGSVVRSGNRVRITAQLIQAATEKRLWGQSYERDLRDVLGLQGEIARDITDEIRITLTSPERARLAQTRATNPDAYLAYAKGRYYWNKRTKEGLQTALRYLEKAIEKDPNYALAFDGIADCWVALGWYSHLPPSDAFPRAKEAVTRALKLDDSLAEAHTSLAFVSLYFDRDWAAAEREFQRAISLNPNYSNAHHWYAEFLSLVGRHEQAVAESQHARELDPLSNIINTWVGSRYFFARQYDKAIEQYRNAVEMDPTFVPVHLVLGHAYEQKRMFQEAIAELERAVSLSGGSPVYLASLAHAYGVAGRRSQAQKVLVDLRRLSEKEYVSAYDLALASLGLGETAQSLALLERAVEERSPRVAFLGVEPRFDKLRSDVRFQQLIARVGIPQKTG